MFGTVDTVDVNTAHLPLPLPFTPHRIANSVHKPLKRHVVEMFARLPEEKRMQMRNRKQGTMVDLVDFVDSALDSLLHFLPLLPSVNVFAPSPCPACFLLRRYCEFANVGHDELVPERRNVAAEGVGYLCAALLVQGLVGFGRDLSSWLLR